LAPRQFYLSTLTRSLCSSASWNLDLTLDSSLYWIWEEMSCEGWRCRGISDGKELIAEKVSLSSQLVYAEVCCAVLCCTVLCCAAHLWASAALSDWVDSEFSISSTALSEVTSRESKSAMREDCRVRSSSSLLLLSNTLNCPSRLSSALFKRLYLI
jgi:hypothetical protein